MELPGQQRVWLFLLILSVFFILLTPNPAFDPDFGWHIRTGEQIVLRGEVPHQDWFTFSMPDFPCISHEWLQDVCFYWLWSVSGLWGIRLWYVFFGMCTLALMLRYFCSPETSLASRCFLAFPITFILLSLLVMRPQLITVLGFTFLLAAYAELVRNPESRIHYWIPAVFVVWVNMHAGFPVGFVLLGVLLAADYSASKLPRLQLTKRFAPKLLDKYRRRQFALVSGVSVLALFINPYGPELLVEVIRTLGDVEGRAQIGDWKATSIGGTGGGMALVGLFALGTAVLLKKLPSLPISAAILVFLIFGFTGSRHAVFFSILALSYVLGQAQVLNEYIDKHIRQITSMTLLLSLTVFAGFIAASSKNPTQFTDGEAGNYPTNIFEHQTLLTKPLKVFAEMEWGGYILLYNPKAKVFMDGRGVFWKRDGKSILDRTNEIINDSLFGSKELLLEGAEAVVVKTDSPLVTGLREDPKTWRELGSDDVSTVFLRTDIAKQ